MMGGDIYKAQIDRKMEKRKDSICLDYRRLSKGVIMQVWIVFFHRAGLYSSKHARHSWFDPQHNCRVRWSHETGAEMKRLAGELGCVCSGAVVTGLWYFSKDFWARVLLGFLGGIALVRAQQEALLPLCYPSPVHATSLPACRCINTCSVIDMAAGISIFLSQHYQCDFDSSGMRLFLTVEGWGTISPSSTVKCSYTVFCKLAAQGRYFSIVLPPT